MKVEAEILVALEALKTAELFLGSDIFDISEFLRTQYLGEDADVTKSDGLNNDEFILNTLSALNAVQD